jgi:hypothetical protein
MEIDSKVQINENLLSEVNLILKKLPSDNKIKLNENLLSEVNLALKKISLDNHKKIELNIGIFDQSDIFYRFKTGYLNKKNEFDFEIGEQIYIFFNRLYDYLENAVYPSQYDFEQLLIDLFSTPGLLNQEEIEIIKSYFPLYHTRWNELLNKINEMNVTQMK